MKKFLTIAILLGMATIVLSATYTNKIYTDDHWIIDYKGPLAPIDDHPAVIVPPGEINPWDAAWRPPGSPPPPWPLWSVPWGMFYQYTNDARWIAWSHHGWHTGYDADCDDPDDYHKYIYSSPSFKIYNNISRATLWASIDDYGGVSIVNSRTGIAYGTGSFPTGYMNLHRYDLTDLFRSIGGSGDPFHLEIDLVNTCTRMSGLIAYLSYDYGTEETFTYRISGNGWAYISMPFFITEAGVDELEDLFPEASDAYLTYDGGNNYDFRWPVDLDDYADTLKTFSFWLNFTTITSPPAMYNITGIPVVEQRYLDYGTNEELGFGTVNCNVPFSNPQDYPDGKLSGASTWESRHADGGGWYLSTTAVRPRYGYLTYPHDIIGTWDLPYSLDLRCEGGSKDILEGEDIHEHTYHSHVWFMDEDSIPAPIDTSVIRDYIEELRRNERITYPIPSHPPTPPIIGSELHKGNSSGSDTPNDFSITVYPSPFNSQVSITLEIPEEDELSIRVFDNTGKLVRDVYDGSVSEGTHEFIWNGMDNREEKSPSGVYYIKAASSEKTIQTKAVLLK